MILNLISQYDSNSINNDFFMQEIGKNFRALTFIAEKTVGK